jgi:flagellar hook protein FlgE
MAGSAFFTAASGLRNHQLRIDAIANNIANVNTTGYKGSNVIFSDVLSQTLRGGSAPSSGFGGINPKQVGLGMQIAAIHNLMQQSALENTARPTDFAINGNGFFTLSDGKSNMFTRAGDFNVDRDGNLVANNGWKIQGYSELTEDGLGISPGSKISDVVINFGQKLAARASTMLNYTSNLDSASFRYGSADNETASFGSTGILTVAGAAEPWAISVGDAITALSAGPETMDINGNTVTYDTSAALSLQEAAGIVADAINIDPTVSLQVQATVRELNGEYQVVIQSRSPGTNIDLTAVSDPASSGLVANLYTAPTEPGKFLVGSNSITVTDAKAATETTSVPMGVGLNRPQAGDSFIINGVTVTLAASAGLADSAEQNAILVATAINGTPNIQVKAVANPNGTISLIQNYAGKQRQPLGAPIDAANADIFIDAAATPGLAARYGFNTLSGWASGALGPDAGIIDNGENAKAEMVFSPKDGSPELVRYYEDWTYDRSTPPAAWSSAFYTASTLAKVQNSIEGSGPDMPLVPGVNISIDSLKPGVATFRTADAETHSTSRVVYDSLGNPHNLVTLFTHVNENEWQYDLSIPDEPNIQLSNTSGRITFSESGLINSGNPLLPLSFLAPGAQPTSIALTFDGRGDDIKGITQFASASTTSAREQDGYPMGVLTDFEADQTGTLIAFYDNGQRRPIAQLSVATFSNPEGLERAGDTAFIPTTNSGSAVQLRPGTGGSGIVFNGFLEQSNVDLAQEFTNMIITQRGLQANSRVFTTQDEILNEIVNLKR